MVNGPMAAIDRRLSIIATFMRVLILIRMFLA